MRDTGKFREAVQAVLNADVCAEHYFEAGDFELCALQQQELGRRLVVLRRLVDEELAEVTAEVPVEVAP